MRNILLNFVQHTSIHGFGHIGKDSSCLRKILWTFLLTCAVTCLVIHINVLLIKYFSYPTVEYNHINRDLNQRVTFPDVTLCNLIFQFQEKILYDRRIYKPNCKGKYP